MSGWQAFLLWLYGAGIAQGLFLVIALSGFKVRNLAARNYLIAIVVVATLMLGGNFLSELNMPSGAGGLAIEFAYGPLIFLFAKAVTDPGSTPVMRDWLHFIPLGLALLLLAGVQASGSLGSVTGEDSGWAIRAWVLMKFPYFCLYAFLALGVLGENRSDVAGRRRKPVVWLYRWVVASTAIVSVMYLDFILLIAGLPAFPEPDQIGGLLLTAVVYSVAYFALVSQRVLQSGAQAAYADIDHRGLADLAHRIDSCFDRQRPYLDPGFSIDDLARLVASDPDRVAAAIRLRHRVGFREAVNARRMDAFLELLTAPGNGQRGILDLAYSAGFNSKATFYRLFKGEKGMSPQEFRRNIAQQGN